MRNSQYAFLWYLGIDILLASMEWKYMCTRKFNAHISQRWKKFEFSCYDITSLLLSWTGLNYDFKFYDFLSMSTSVVVPSFSVYITIHKLHTDIFWKRPDALLTQSLTPPTLALVQHRLQASNNYKDTMVAKQCHEIHHWRPDIFFHFSLVRRLMILFSSHKND